MIVDEERIAVALLGGPPVPTRELPKPFECVERALRAWSIGYGNGEGTGGGMNDGSGRAEEFDNIPFPSGFGFGYPEASDADDNLGWAPGVACGEMSEDGTAFGEPGAPKRELLGFGEGCLDDPG